MRCFFLFFNFLSCILIRISSLINFLIVYRVNIHLYLNSLICMLISSIWVHVSILINYWTVFIIIPNSIYLCSLIEKKRILRTVLRISIDFKWICVRLYLYWFLFLFILVKYQFFNFLNQMLELVFRLCDDAINVESNINCKSQTHYYYDYPTHLILQGYIQIHIF